MPFETHLRVTCSGILGSTASPLERFSYGMCLTFQDISLLGANATDALFHDLAVDFAGFHANPAACISASATLQEFKVAQIGPDGKYSSDPYIETIGNAGQGLPGGKPHGGAALVPQSALCVSLTTDLRGPTGKGRFYLPLPVVTPDVANGFLISVADAESIRNAVVDLCANIKNEPNIDLTRFTPVVASSKGYNTPVTGVRVGRVVDTMRSRRRSLPEHYTAISAVA